MTKKKPKQELKLIKVTFSGEVDINQYFRNLLIQMVEFN